MSSSHDTKPQDLGPERLKPGQGTRTLGPRVEATSGASDLCTGDATRERILVWLAEGAREVSWALCALPREHWTTPPAAHPSDWPTLRHARHLALRETHLVLPAVRQALGEGGNDAAHPLTTTLEYERADAAWDPAEAVESAEAIIAGLGETRFELLQRLESAPDEAWDRPITASVGSQPQGGGCPVRLDWLLLDARQHELEHLAAMWKIALSWDGFLKPRIPIPGVPLHPADRPEESH